MSLRSKPPTGVNPVMPVFAPETSGSARKPASPLRFISLRSKPPATLIGRDAACRVSTRKVCARCVPSRARAAHRQSSEEL